MLIRWVYDSPRRKAKHDPYLIQVGDRETLWFLFIPIFSFTRWP